MEKEPSFLSAFPCETRYDTTRGIRYFQDAFIGDYGITDKAAARLEESISIRRTVAWEIVRLRIQRAVNGLVICDDDEPRLENLTRQTIDELLISAPKNAEEMIEQSLLNLSSDLVHPSERAKNADNAWAVYAFNNSSRRYMLEQLQTLGYLSSDPSQVYRIEAKGWEKVSALRRAGATERKQAFVAMWFSTESDAIYRDGIAPALAELSMTPVRIDQREHNNKICDEIIAEIKRSKFVIADFTGNRGGVYYEAGYAHGLGKPVIWTVRVDHLSDVHFDTRQYNHITYSNAMELKERLFNRIRATI